MKKIICLIIIMVTGMHNVACAEPKTVRNQLVTNSTTESTSKEKTLMYTVKYIAKEYSSEKYSVAPVMKIGHYSDGSAVVNINMDGQAVIYGGYPYGIVGNVILYTGTDRSRRTFAEAEILIFDNRVTLNLIYPMGECETVVFEQNIE